MQSQCPVCKEEISDVSQSWDPETNITIYRFRCCGARWPEEASG